MSFHERGITAPDGLETAAFILRPIVADDAELDYEAVMETRELLRVWNQSTWPEDDFTVEANRKDMVTMERRSIEGRTFDYTMMNPEQTEVLGCVYIFPTDVKWFSEAVVTAVGDDAWSDCDAMIHFWVRKSRLPEGLDRLLLDTLRSWFNQEWRLENPVFVTNEQFDQQVAMIEGTDLQRRFEIQMPGEPGRYLAYA